jgi:hypothetical protein
VAKLFDSADGLSGDRFGEAVAVDGMQVVVAAPFRHEPQPDVGALYLFERLANGNYPLLKKFVPTVPKVANSAKLGSALAMDKTRVIAGAYWDFQVDQKGKTILQAGSTYIFEF